MAQGYVSGGWATFRIRVPGGNVSMTSGTRILNLAQPPLTYPLLGSRHRNEVVSGSQWVTITDSEGVTAHSPDLPVERP